MHIRKWKVFPLSHRTSTIVCFLQTPESSGSRMWCHGDRGGGGSWPHVEADEAGLIQLLPQLHLHAHVVVDVEGHAPEHLVVVVVRILGIVWRHEAIGVHLQGAGCHCCHLGSPHNRLHAILTNGQLRHLLPGTAEPEGPLCCAPHPPQSL